MNVGVITVSNNEVVSSEKNDCVKLICSQLYKNGFQVLFSQTIKSDFVLASNIIKQGWEQVDTLLLICDNEVEKNFKLKKIVADMFNVELAHSEFAKNNIDEYLKSQNVPLRKEENSCCLLPQTARCIKNPFSAYQGFLIEKEQKTLFFLPLTHSELKNMFFCSVLPYISKKLDGKINTEFVFKTFGLKLNEMNLLLKDFIKNKHNIEVVTNEYLLSGEILINIPRSTRKEVVDHFVQGVYTKILPYFYSDSDMNLPELIVSLLKITGKKVVFAEDFTCGRLFSTFYESLTDAKDFLLEGYFVPSEEAKIKLLGVDKEVFNRAKVDYGEVAYQLALGALENSGADFVVSNCGLLEDGNMTYALGSCEGIYIYNQNFTGSIEQKTIQATNTIFFSLAKKLKQNDFHLKQNTI